MSQVGQLERLTQQHVLRFFQDELGYRYLGDWKGRAGNRNIDEFLLSDWLARQGHDERVVNRALRELDQAAAIAGSKTLYDANRAVYEKLRYGVHVKPSVQEQMSVFTVIDGAAIRLFDGDMINPSRRSSEMGLGVYFSRVGASASG